MILEFIINISISLINFIFSAFSIPSLPVEGQNAINSVFDFLAIPMGVMRTMIGDNFLAWLFPILIILVLLSPTINISIWLYKRIRG